jgi:hypothetical protein
MFNLCFFSFGIVFDCWRPEYDFNRDSAKKEDGIGFDSNVSRCLWTYTPISSATSLTKEREGGNEASRSDDQVAGTVWCGQQCSGVNWKTSMVGMSSRSGGGIKVCTNILALALNGLYTVQDQMRAL